jgi:ankyrin repeat protein
MSVTGGALPNEPTWQGNLESLEHEIESLRTDSSSQQTARIRACVATSLQSLNKESAPSIKDFNQRCTDLQSHLSRLEALCNEPKLFGVFRPDKIRMSRIFGSKTKSSVQEVCKRIQEIMKKFLKDKVSEGVGDKQSIDEEIEKIQEPWHMQIALACSANSCFSGNAQDRISLLSQIKELSPNHNLDYPTVLSLISLIPEEKRTPRNIALFINATKDMTKADSQTFVINMRNIPYENRVYTLQSVVDYLNIGVRSSNDKICQLLQASNHGYTGLHLAVMFGSREALGELLDRSDFDVNIRDHSGQTPLYLAAKSGDKELVDLLLSIEETDVNLSDLSDCTPLHIAIQFGRKEVIESLLKNKNIDVNLFDGKGQTSIYLALQSGNKELVEALIPRTTININHRYRDGKTLLDMAVRSGNKEIVELLLKIKGINVNLSDREGFTPLFVAPAMDSSLINH